MRKMQIVMLSAMGLMILTLVSEAQPIEYTFMTYSPWDFSASLASCGLEDVENLENRTCYPEFNANDFALSFLRDVAGFDTSNYEIHDVSVLTYRIPNSQHHETIINATVGGKDNNFIAFLTLVDGKFWIYDLHPQSGELNAAKRNLDEDLNLAAKTIEEYGRFYNVSYCHKLAEVVSTALETRSLTMDNDNVLLRIIHDENSALESTKLWWFTKINNQFTTNARSLSMSISKSGFMSRIIDNLGIYYVANTSINVSEQEVINIATPYAEAYALEHGQKIVSNNITFAFIRDAGSLRGDDFAIYPSWSVLFAFDKFNEESAYEYGVMIWADNGEVGDYGPRMVFHPREGSDTVYLWLILAVIPIALALSCLGTYYRRRHKNRRIPR